MSANGRWAERKIVDGVVKFHGSRYRVVEDVPYDGRLDGRRALFYEYSNSEHWPNLRDRVFLHSFPDPSNEEHGMDWPGPNCIDGYFHWETWERAS